MSAQDNLSPAQFYHGTNKEFHAGDFISPGHRAVWEQSSEHHVYATGDPDAADHYAQTAVDMQESGSPHVYSVEPTGKVEPDPDPAGEDFGFDAWRSRKPMRVLGEV